MVQFIPPFALFCLLLSCQSPQTDAIPVTNAAPTAAVASPKDELGTNPKVDSLLQIGKQYFEQKNVAAALATYEKALQIDPKSAEVYYEMGLTYAISKNMPAAIRSFDKAVQLNPTNAKAHGNLGFALYLVEDRENAEIHLRKAIALDPQNGKFQHNLGAFLTDTNDPTACDYLRKARQLGYEDPTHFLEQKCK